MIQNCATSFSSLRNGHFKLAVNSWPFFKKLYFAQKKCNCLVNGGRTQDEVHANHQIPVIGYDWPLLAICIYYFL